MSSNLYLKDGYNSPIINYIISTYIREYDIEKANINILLKYGAITQEQYNKFLSMDSYSRKVAVGYLLRDNQEANKILRDGFVESRRLFFEANNIQDHEVLSIKKDAIFLINRIPSVLDFGQVRFIEKNIYTSFYKISNLEFYYYLDYIHNIEKLDIKGISDENLKLHENYMLDFLKYIFEIAQTSHISEVITIITNFYKQYINMELDIGYYRELNSMSKYNISTKTFSSFYADMLPDKDKKYLDISCNREILQTLYSYYSNIYFSSVGNKR